MTKMLYYGILIRYTVNMGAVYPFGVSEPEMPNVSTVDKPPGQWKYICIIRCSGTDRRLVSPRQYTTKGSRRMTKNLKRFFSMLLALSLVFSLVLPAAATETEEHDHAAHVEETTQEANQAEPINLEAALENITVNAEELEFETSFDNYLVLVDPDTEIDMEDPAILAFESELKEIKVLNAEGEPTPLTPE